jgi:hypothetical protein
MEQPESVASKLIRWMEVPGQPKVFALGNFARQVTFASQQARAFNLIWALFKENRLASGQRVAVIGAGLGGLTATVAALAKECFVDLFEHASQPCPLQRGNDIRFIHPNILRWPEDGSERDDTDFPFLNWTAANVRGVIKQIDLQWNMRTSNNSRLNKFFNYRVNRLYTSQTKSGPQKPWLSANRVVDAAAKGNDITTAGYVEFTYDCVILAVGFGEERSIAGVPFLSYWQNDSLHQETGRGKQSVLVSGCGDGGLIDALRLRLLNFDHAEFVRRFLNVDGAQQLFDDLRRIETDLKPKTLSPDISSQFQASYETLKVPAEIEKYFRETKRADTTVTLNSPASGPLSFKASLLNRYATYLAMRYADLHYLSGRVTAERSDSGGFMIVLERDDIGARETGPFDAVIVRHGPENIIGRLVPKSAIAEMQSLWTTIDDITTQPHWQDDDYDMPHQFFRDFETETVASRDDVIGLALATFDSAYWKFRRESKDVESVAVGDNDGKPGLIVTLKAGSTAPKTMYYAGGVLVQYVVAPGAPTVQPSTQVRRRLPIGMGIYNADIQRRLEQAVTDNSGATTASPDTERTTDSYSPTIGTLGCFAKDQKNRVHLLTASYVLGFHDKAQIGDLVFVEGENPLNAQPVAKVSGNSLLPATVVTGSEAPSVGIGSACCELGIVPDFDGLPPPWQIRGVGPAKIGDRVAKFGRTSGLTTGIVELVDLTVNLSGFGKRLLLVKDCLKIRGDNGTEFSLAGDGGSAVVRDDGTVLGIIIGAFAGSKDKAGSSIASPIDRALEELHLELLTSDGSTASASKATAKRRQRSKPKKKTKT